MVAALAETTEPRAAGEVAPPLVSLSPIGTAATYARRRNGGPAAAPVPV